jgi:hypothetical protein
MNLIEIALKEIYNNLDTAFFWAEEADLIEMCMRQLGDGFHATYHFPTWKIYIDMDIPLLKQIIADPADPKLNIQDVAFMFAEKWRKAISMCHIIEETYRIMKGYPKE